MGNICRSPAGENILRHQAAAAGVNGDLRIDSAGTHDYHPGKSPDNRMCATLRKRGIPCEGRARQFTAQDFLDFDLILTMDDENYANVAALDPEEIHRGKVKKFTGFCRDEDNQHPEVPDPYYGGSQGFERVADMLEDGCAEILRRHRAGRL